MFPVLLTIGNWPLSSFGLFLIISLFFGSFYLWKLSRLFEIDNDKVLDLVLIVFFVSLFGARLYFVFSHMDFFFGDLGGDLPFMEKLVRVFMLTKYPGLSFWGALFSGFATLVLLCRRLKVDFWQIGDFGAVGFFMGLAISSVGCFLGGCQIGKPSTNFIAVRMVGLTDKRLPVQIIEAVIFFLIFLYLLKRVRKYHYWGEVLGVGLIFLGVTKFILEFLRGDIVSVFGISLGFLFSMVVLVAGVFIFYKSSKRKITSDLRKVLFVITNSDRRRIVLSKLVRACYNQTIFLKTSLARQKREFLRRLNIRSTPKEF